MSISKVFVSYSQDLQAHKKWVLDFSTRLRNVGVDAVLDQWDLGPGDDLPNFMEKNLASADRVIMICTENYVQKADAGTGGVGYEKMIVTADLMKRVESKKVIPIIRQVGTRSVPVFLTSKLFVDFSREDQFEEAFDDLTRNIHESPLFVKPPVANNPFIQVDGTHQRRGDGILELMTHLMDHFERDRSGGYLYYHVVAGNWNGSRTMLDVLLGQAADEGLIKLIRVTYIDITLKGKAYALQNKIVR